MSEATVEATRELIDAFNSRNVEALAALFAPEAEIIPIRAAVEDVSYSGPDLATKWIAAIDEAWDHLTAEPGEIRDLGDRVLGIGRVHGRGRASGAEIDVEAVFIARFDGERITHLRLSTDVSGTLEAAGLSE